MCVFEVVSPQPRTFLDYKSDNYQMYFISDKVFNYKIIYSLTKSQIMGKKITLILFLVLTWTSFILAQSTIKGTVTNAEDGEPLIAASVSVKGTTQGVMTDIDGNYTIKVEKDAQLIESEQLNKFLQSLSIHLMIK